jgi:hypothetical protein
MAKDQQKEAGASGMVGFLQALITGYYLTTQNR